MTKVGTMPQAQTLITVRIREITSKCSFTVFLRAGMLSGKNILNGICWKTPGALNTPSTLPPYTPPQGRQCVWYRNMSTHHSEPLQDIEWVHVCEGRVALRMMHFLWLRWAFHMHGQPPLFTLCRLVSPGRASHSRFMSGWSELWVDCTGCSQWPACSHLLLCPPIHPFRSASTKTTSTCSPQLCT